MKFKHIFKTHNFGLNYSDKTLTAELLLQGNCINYHHRVEADTIPGVSLSVSEQLITPTLQLRNYINLLRIESQCFLFISIILESNSIVSERN